MKIYGVDFTSAPCARKAITVAGGVLRGSQFAIESLECLQSFSEFERFLTRPGPWIGGFDFPFGLPREAVEALGWPTTWPDLVAHCAMIGRKQFTLASDRLRKSRPKGRKYPKRRGDDLAASHSPMKCVRPPVGWMFVEGAPRLLKAGLTIPGLFEGDPERVAIESYPGYLARGVIGRRSYKQDLKAKQTPERREARRLLLAHLKGRNPTGIALCADAAIEKKLLEDGSGDLLDAAICALQAGWAWRHRHAGFGLPTGIDRLEGWIATVPAKHSSST